jgi:hypothetical protein
MAVRRDLRPLLAVTVLGVAIALAESVTGLDTGLLLLSSPDEPQDDVTQPNRDEPG